jgi:hypothetical protein
VYVLVATDTEEPSSAGGTSPLSLWWWLLQDDTANDQLQTTRVGKLRFRLGASSVTYCTSQLQAISLVVKVCSINWHLALYPCLVQFSIIACA